MRISPQVSNRNQFFLTLLLLVFIILASFLAGFLASRYLPFLTKGNFSILYEAYAILEANFIDDLPSQNQLEYGMIQGMLSKLSDPYTVFVAPAQHELQTNQLEGKFGGIGARIELDTDGFLLLFPFPGSPAEEAGVQEGDRLLMVDGLVVSPGTPLDEVQAAVRGPVGKKLEMVVASPPDFVERTVLVERQEIALPSVTWNLASADERAGVIQVNIIAATTPEEVKKAVLDLQSNGAEYYILDLRNNSGGLLTAGVETAELFLPEGVILQQQYRGKPVESIVNENDGMFLSHPLAILVNHGSASAAEIIAGALQAQGRGVVVGSNTFGKDSIQLVFDLSDGSSLHVTAAKWWVPGISHALGEQGLIPDISIPEEEIMLPETLQTAIDYLVQSNTSP